MATNFLTKIFGSRNDRLLKQYRKVVARINSMEPEYEKLSDDALRAKTQEFKDRVAKGESLDSILPEAFAVVREGSKRIMKMRHFDVQMLGGMALHHGKISEMRTGEGKTLTATLPVYLNALSGKGVHVVTVNDYLANRDAQWMGRLYNFLGLTVGINLPNMPREEKQAAYRADITYGTNNEYGFDYLRDNMVYEARDRVQQGLNYAIVDEVDSILIDEARTPLIISGQAEDHTALYLAMNKVVPLLVRQEGEADPRTGEGVIKPGDFTLDEKSHQVFLTEQGHETAERVLAAQGLLPEGTSLYDPANISLMHHLYAALRGHHLYNRDQHYVVQNGEIVIVDEFTGRLMSGRRWSEGLHQAVEAKEGVEIQAENQTLASITFQNYFRLYNKLSGMTGTADTEAYEFQEIYGLETIVVPPNQPSRREDQLDRVYKTTKEKYDAAIKDIRECYERGQPVLVGTTSIENSEIIDQLLNAANLPHQVLNAKQHAREADIIVQAGRPGAITIATNMAGRGTDIVLGGNLEKMLAAVEADASLDEATKATRMETLRQQWQQDHDKVKALGGLRIIATERHESRRIDNQLRGRSGRQGDPGSSRFYLSLEDDLMRLFGSDRIKGLMEKLGLRDGEAIENAMVTRAVEGAQKRVEAHHFEIRKTLLDYDNVMNQQREVIYALRREIMVEEDLDPVMDEFMNDVLDDVYSTLDGVPVDDHNGLREAAFARLRDVFNLDRVLPENAPLPEREECEPLVRKVLEELRSETGESYRDIQRYFMLEELDRCWKEHLRNMDALRDGIGLRGYGQRDPKLEYKREGFEMFQAMLFQIRENVFRALCRVRLAPAETAPVEAIEIAPESEEPQGQPLAREYRHKEDQGKLSYSGGGDEESRNTPAKAAPRIGRNDPCPCGSGRKYKKCCGADK